MVNSSGDKFKRWRASRKNEHNNLIQDTIFKLNASIIEIHADRVSLTLGIGCLQLQLHRPHGLASSGASEFELKSRAPGLREQLIQLVASLVNFTLL